ncbi:MAG: hypothetical protein LUF34_10340 [Lachnospiraceae bacterium]|nr:hypothetical protein [Lachnospiraceae bacterium]
MRHHITSPGRVLPILAAGILLGGLFGSGPGREWTEEFGIFSTAYQEWLVSGVWETEPHFLQLAAVRGGPFLLLLLAGRGRSLCLTVLLFWYSFSSAVFWSVCLWIYGLRGIVFFLISLFPHWLFYGLALGVMASQMAANWYRWRRSLPVFISLLVLGMAAEACLHPRLVRWILSVMQ